MKKQIKSMVALLVLACIMLSIVGCTRSAKLVQVDGKWHYYDAKGKEQHGFVEYKENTYYITEDGTMNTGFWLNKEDEEYYYSDSDGIVQKNKFVDVDGRTYYLKADGKRQYGWAEIDGKTMYFSNKDDGHMVKKGWIYDIPPEGGNKEYYYYFGDDGNMFRNEIKEINDKKYYFADDGKMKTGFVDFQGASYHFASDGAMDTGSWFNKENIEFYYSDSNGIVQKNKFIDIDGVTYYYTADGTVQHEGWAEIDGKTMYFRKDGSFFKKTNVTFVPEGENMEYRIYFGDDGHMLRNEFVGERDGEIYDYDNDGKFKDVTMNTGFWLNKEDEEYYYSDSDGIVQKNKFVDVDGRTYYLKADGKRQYGWAEIDGKTMYFSNKGDGHMVRKGWVYVIPPEGGVGERYYYFGDDGNMIRNEIKEINGKKYYLADDGKMETGFVNFQGAIYHFAPNGSMNIGSFKTKGVIFNTDEYGRIIN